MPDDIRNNLVPQDIKGCMVPEKFGYPDQEFLTQAFAFFRRTAEEIHVVLEPFITQLAHSPADTPENGWRFIIIEIVLAAFFNQAQHFRKHALIRLTIEIIS